ncbi:MAG: oxidoreductase [Gemmatimonadaceae bacterium]
MTVNATTIASAQWVSQASGTTADLRGISVVGEKIAWVSGTRGRFARTVDGGEHWHADSIAGADSLDLRAIHALDGRIAWALSAGDADKGMARIYHTRDGGNHWTLQYSTLIKGVFFDALAFWDARHGIAVSDAVDGRLFILTTTDGGVTWVRVLPAAIPPALPGEGAFAASGSCLTVQGGRNAWIGTGGGVRARVFRSTDRGLHWDVSDTPVQAGTASAGIFSVTFRDARHGFAVGGDYRRPKDRTENVTITKDGGRTWSSVIGPRPMGYMSAVSYTRRGQDASLVAVGLTGTALSTDGGASWYSVDSAAFNGARFSAGGAGWAVGSGGRVAKWRADDLAPNLTRGRRLGTSTRSVRRSEER